MGTAAFAQLFEKLMGGPSCFTLRVQNNLDMVPTVPEGLGIYHHVCGGLWLQRVSDQETKVRLTACRHVQ